MKKIFFYSFFILVLAFIFTSYELIKYSDDKLHLIICDVGQGEAIFIVTPEKSQILIDGGPGKAVLECLGENMPFWDRSIDMVILTHPHADHYAGLIDVVDRYGLKSFYTQDVKSDSDGYKLLEAKLAERNLSAKYLKEGDNFKLKSGMELEILSPSLFELKKYNQSSAYMDVNESSIVSLLSYGNFSALLTGDAEMSVINKLNFGVKNIKVLKIPHHGSSGAVTEEFLSKISPDLSLISVGEGNKFGHPSKDTISLLNKYKIINLRTDINGEIELITNGKDLEIESENR